MHLNIYIQFILLCYIITRQFLLFAVTVVSESLPKEVFPIAAPPILHAHYNSSTQVQQVRTEHRMGCIGSRELALMLHKETLQRA